MSHLCQKHISVRRKKKLHERSNLDEEINTDLINYFVVTVF